ncbi:hypothetical protein GBAR_LOCUS19676 [Geodia barretti]|uniref:Uncharacterized protein n=1 Tax=Geodia barretti TaxID=519541 RepID=A0AA35SUP0_GEOBA|nr:hypothetical protein GBAR_LOCUS19676 [Geodia barretti]
MSQEENNESSSTMLRLLTVARESVKLFIECIFECCSSISKAVLNQLRDLKSKNAEHRSKHRGLKHDVIKLHQEVVNFIELVCRYPEFDKESISAELSSEDSNATFDPKNNAKFKVTIDFLSRLDIWIEIVEDKLEKVHKDFEAVRQKTAEASKEAKKNEYEAHGRGIGVGLYLYKSSKDFKQLEYESCQLSIELDKLNKYARNLDAIAEMVEKKREAETSFKIARKNIERLHPLLSTITVTFTDIFRILEKGKDLEDEKNLALNYKDD